MNWAFLFRWLLVLGAVALGTSGCATSAAGASPSRAVQPQSAPAEYGYAYAGEADADEESAPGGEPAGAGFRQMKDLVSAPAEAAGNVAPGPPPEAGQTARGEPPPATNLPSSTTRRPMLIYTAQVTMAVFEARKAIDAVERMAKELGGYLVVRSDAAITVRVPADAFDRSLERLRPLGDELHREVSARDVTEEFHDLTLQLKNLEAMRQRFEQLLSRADSVKDALAVEKELQRVTGEIERLKGRLKLLSELVAFSTVTVRFEARPVDRVGSHVELPFPWIRSLGLPELLNLRGES